MLKKIFPSDKSNNNLLQRRKKIQQKFVRLEKKYYFCRLIPQGAEKRRLDGRPPPGHNLLIIRQMYVIVEINGQQFKAEQGQKLFIHHIPATESGATVEFDRVLLVDADGKVQVGTPVVKGAKVVCEVLSPIVKGDKVLIFHKKRRKGHRKLNGHRQQFTEVSVKEILV